jgi:hypothetical protein
LHTIADPLKLKNKAKLEMAEGAKTDKVKK